MNNFTKTILFLLFSLICSVSNGQIVKTSDVLIDNYPSKFDSYEALAEKIKTDFSTDADRAKAAFIWLAKHIKYDTKGVNQVQKIRFSYSSEEDLQAQKKQFRKNLALETLKSQKALCEGYATLYQEICLFLNIECVLIPGTAKRFVSEIGNTNLASNHAWNAVKINGKWKLVDITWAAGSVDYAKMEFMQEYTPAYFDSEPEEFAMKHYPDDEEWLLLNKKLSKEEFAFQPAVLNAFLGKGYKIIHPQNGAISSTKGKEIEFSIENITNEIQIAYHFKSEKFGQIVKPIRKKNQISFKVPTNLKGKTELIIYFDNEPVLGYKVNVK
ncbi:hypothetical protein BZG02_16765 [Labilibaculum filiforme]|uniref:Transglutaminase-like domain-containing protein n=1 Tax=Labilibaculum filiforme TaxID=1940526 RepID=A0A2N3HSS7_9BACT|nr:transglutaminase domain-containing protein [Labilibaculum filiforme]PKQ61097.1 hypothetical protein BZG02_16765 [Labilibaculum filiforme]